MARVEGWRKKRDRKARRGTSTIEFSMMMPWFVFLFVGAFDWGFFAHALISTQSAARVAALYTPEGRLHRHRSSHGLHTGAEGAERRLQCSQYRNVHIPSGYGNTSDRRGQPTGKSGDRHVSDAESDSDSRTAGQAIYIQPDHTDATFS
jgi:hypothetical protein